MHPSCKSQDEREFVLSVNIVSDPGHGEPGEPSGKMEGLDLPNQWVHIRILLCYQSDGNELMAELERRGRVTGLEINPLLVFERKDNG